MEKRDKLVAYGILILALSAVLMSWVSHSAHKVEPPKAVLIPWTGPPSQTTPPSTGRDTPSQASVPTNPPPEEQHSSAQPDAHPANQPSPHPDDASPAYRPTIDFSASSDEAPSPPDSEQTPRETASQRVARRMGRH